MGGMALLGKFNIFRTNLLLGFVYAQARAGRKSYAPEPEA